MSWFWKNSMAKALAFLTLAVCGGLALHASAEQSSDKLYRAQIAACERTNKLRMENNERIEAHITDRDALIAFLHAARAARLAAYERDGNQIELDTANEYKDLIERLQTKVKFDPIDVVNCQKVVEKP